MTSPTRVRPVAAGALLIVVGLAAAAPGCFWYHGPLDVEFPEVLEEVRQIQTVEVTDAFAYDRRRANQAKPPRVVSDPDALNAVHNWLLEMEPRWRPAKGEPSSVRFQVRLLANGRPYGTLWLGNGSVQMSDGGNRLRSARLSTAETAQAAALFGLHPAELAMPRLPDDRGPKPAEAGARTMVGRR